MKFTNYHAQYFAYELTRRSPSFSIEKFTETLSNAQVDIKPHQIDAALFAFQSPLSQGAILADEVGLGKTIEAGIVISQKWAEGKKKILIITPANLRKQWYQELADKFYLSSIILETKSFNQHIKEGNLNPFEQEANIIIISMNFARGKSAYLKAINWDLVVVDEAHRLRNVYKPNSKVAKEIKSAIQHAPKLLLTATPLQNSLMELYGLVSIVDEHIFGDKKSFQMLYARPGNNNEVFHELKERLKIVCNRTLRQHVQEYIQYTKRMAHTVEFIPTPKEQDLYQMLTQYLFSEKLYALPNGQRQLITLMLRKLLASSTFAVEKTLRLLSDRLQSILTKAEQDEKPQEEELKLDSEIESFSEYQEGWKEDQIDEENEDDSEEKIEEEKAYYTVKEREDIQKEKKQLDIMAELARSIGSNSKGEKLLEGIKIGFEEVGRIGGTKKALIFTESTRTQQYICEILEASEYKDKIVLFNGSNNDAISKKVYARWIEENRGTDKVTGSKTADIRSAIVDFFKNDAEIMIATEAAAEGINLQFCSLVINYDLPWNPQRIEQRIGRCHRYGQKHDVVVINFLNRKNEADKRVYELLKEKFQLFDGVFGSSDEVLGSIASGIDFEKRIANIYQQCRTEAEIKETFDKLQQEMEEQITETLHDTKRKLLDNFDEDVHKKLKMSMDQSTTFLDSYRKWLWNLTYTLLDEKGKFNEETGTFEVHNGNIDGDTLLSGKYTLHLEDTSRHHYRSGHPLAKLLISTAKKLVLPPVHIEFYSTKGPKIASLEPYHNVKGYLQVTLVKMKTLDESDYIVCSAITEDGRVIESDIIKKLFSLPGREIEPALIQMRSELEAGIIKEQNCIFENVKDKNKVFFEDSYQKLERWSDDLKIKQKEQILILEKDIKQLKKDARFSGSLSEKLEKRQQLRKLEEKLDIAEQKYRQDVKVIESDKDKLLDKIQDKMHEQIEQQTLFTISWQIL
ncbi:MAG: SNF2-related protein [Candidatus Roizmanbacteria bacterium]